MSARPPEITTITLGDLSTNCYVLSCPSTNQAVVIDPADTGEVIAEEILRQNLDLQAIWLTHAHFDHVLGLLPLVMSFNIPVYLHPADQFLLENAGKSAQYWLQRTVDPVPNTTTELKPGQELGFGKFSFEVLHSPGHTPGSCSFLWKGETTTDVNEYKKFTQPPLLFAGDVIFAEGIGRTDFRYSDPKQLDRSIIKLQKRAAGAAVYPGHGEGFLLR
ncbi:MAG: MBL fold metallo-hydrolase [Patescibacteria group bacterium]